MSVHRSKSCTRQRPWTLALLVVGPTSRWILATRSKLLAVGLQDQVQRTTRCNVPARKSTIDSKGSNSKLRGLPMIQPSVTMNGITKRAICCGAIPVSSEVIIRRKNGWDNEGRSKGARGYDTYDTRANRNPKGKRELILD